MWVSIAADAKLMIFQKIVTECPYVCVCVCTMPGCRWESIQTLDPRGLKDVSSSGAGMLKSFQLFYSQIGLNRSIEIVLEVD